MSVRAVSARSLFTIALFALAAANSAADSSAAKISWQGWSDDIFQRAKAEQRFVLLHLGAGWCHWCHVMEAMTYTDPTVIGLIGSKYIAVHVDQDSRPDLSNRYEEYGWPATIVFAPDGSELVKRSGYIPPKPMASLLQAIIDDPTPGPSITPEPVVIASNDSALTEAKRKEMRDLFIGAYDEAIGGWGEIHKYVNWDAIEYCLTEGASGDARMAGMATKTLTSSLKLIDPVWGGVYQYSTDGDWDHPHFEKIMPFQAENLRVFSLAAALLRDPQWLKPAQQIRSYLKQFLTSPDGAFYTSQDADVVPGEHSGEFFSLDDAGRRALGIPRIDRHIYARENGLAITGLVALYAASGDPTCLDDARRATEWIIAQRSLPEGGFRHDETDVAGPYLGDTLAMARAFLALYTATAERSWLARAESAADFIETKFHAGIGYTTSASGMASLPSKPQLDENVNLVRFANLLHHHTGKPKYRTMAEHAMRYLAAPVVVDQQGFATSPILLADREIRTEPMHLTVVGSKNNATARSLFDSALRNTPGYARLEWYDPSEGPLPRTEVQYPKLEKPAAFVCTQGACSQPLTSPESLSLKLALRSPDKH